MRKELYNTKKLEEKWENLIMMFLEHFVCYIEIKTKYPRKNRSFGKYILKKKMIIFGKII